MDNATYDELNLIPINSDATYSRLRTTQTTIKPNDDLERRADIDQSTIKGAKQTLNTNKASNTTTFNTVIITMLVILLLFTLASIALSITTFSRLTFDQVSQLDKNEDKDTSSAVFNLTQLLITQSNISEILTQLDNRIKDFISVHTKDTSLHTQSNCGPGLWWRVAYLDMAAPSKQCPSAWREYNASGVRACGSSNS